jgi:hypothetical protein
MDGVLHVTPENPQESAEYQQQMIDKFDQAQNQATQADSSPNPELLAGKYKTPEDLENAVVELIKKQYSDPAALAEFYKTLESNLGKPRENQKPDQTQGEPSESSSSDEPSGFQKEEVQSALEAKGLDLSEFEAEFMEQGQLSEDSYTKLEQAGFPRQLVDAYITGQQALAAQFQNQVFSLVGGEEAYTKMVQWASQNLSDAEKRAFNEVLETGDLAKVQLAVEALHSRYMKANPSAPNLLSGQPPTSSVAGYASRAEMIRDMQDPRYEKDPAFRKLVEQRVAVSNIF